MLDKKQLAKADAGIKILKSLVAKGMKISDKDIRDAGVAMMTDGLLTAKQAAAAIANTPDKPDQRLEAVKQELAQLYAHKIHHGMMGGNNG